MGKESRQTIQLDKEQFESKTIKENITMMKNALDSSINAIAISNFEGKLMYVNPAFLRMWGYDDEMDVLGRFAVDFWRIRDVASVVLKETQKKGFWFGELVAQKTDGKNLIVQVSTSLIRNESDEVCGIIASFIDITKQKKVKEALQKSEKRFQNVALCSADFIWEIDKEARYTFASGKVKEILGYEASELIGKTPFDLMLEKEAKDIGEVFNKISFEKKPIVDLENWNQTKQGKKVCLLTNGIPLLDENGNLIGYRGVDKDITKRKQMERELQKSEERYRTLLENSSDSIYVLDYEWRHLLVNKAATRFVKMPKEKIIGNKLTDLFPNVEKTLFFKTFKKVMETRKPDTVADEYIFEDARRGFYEVNVSPVPEGILCISRDITERKKAGEALRKSEESYSLLFESTKDGILISNSKGRVTSVNPAAAKMLGYKEPEELLGMPAVNFYANPEHRRALFYKLKKMGYVRNFEIKVKKKDGSYADFQVTVTLHKDKKGNILRTESLFRDITEHKKAQGELKAEKKKLEVYIESMIDGVVIADVNGTIIHVNKTWIRMLGCKSSKEVIGKTFFEFLAKREVPRCRKRFSECMKNKEEFIKNFEVVHRRKDGSEFCILLNNTNLWDKEGKYIAGIAVLRDITEQKKIEEELVKYRHHLEELVKKRTVELEHANQELDSVINSASEIIIAFNSNNQVTAWNKSVELLTGYKQKEVIGKNISQLNIFDNPEDLKDIRENCLNGSHYKLHPLKTKNVLNTKIGGRIIVSFSISTIKDKKGQYNGCLFIGKDVTSDPNVHGKLLMGSSYLVSEKTNKSTITLFTNLTSPDSKGLFITRGDPNIIRNTVSFLNAQAVLFKQNRANGFENITDLEGLKTKIKKFAKENKNSVIVIDRVDYLITNFSFEEFAKTLYQITDVISENNALLLFHIDPKLLDDRQMAIITNELQALPSQKIEDIQLKDEIFDILRFIYEQNQKNVTVSFKKVSKEFSIVDKTTTKRLRILKDEGLIFVKKLGRIKSLNISEKGKTLLNKREIV